MNVLITGGAGYLGTELARSLASMDQIKSILIYDNLSRGNYNLFLGPEKLPSHVRFQRSELLDTRALLAAMAGIDIVFHLAANITTPFAEQNPHFLEQVNHWGTAELVYAVEESNVGKLVYLSSTSVYGASTDEVDVDSQLHPQTHYGVSKMRGEQHVMRLQQSGFPAWIVRCGNVYGYSKSMRFDSVINRFMFEANFYRKINIHGKGEQYRSFVHIDRVSNIIGNLATCPTLDPGVYNLVENTMSIMSVAEAVRSIYPDLEMIFMNQMMNLRQLRVKPDPRIDEVASLDACSLQDQLIEFRKALTF